MSGRKRPSPLTSGVLIRSSLPRRRRRLHRVTRHPAFVMASMALLLLGLIYSSLFALTKARVSQPLEVSGGTGAREPQPHALLIALTDGGEGLDTKALQAAQPSEAPTPWLSRMLWVLADGRKSTTIVVSIPAGLRVRAGDGGYSHLYSEWESDPARALEAVSELTGFSTGAVVEARIDRVVTVLDVLGGIYAAPLGSSRCRAMDGSQAMKPVRIPSPEDEHLRARYTVEIASKALGIFASKRSLIDPLRAFRLSAAVPKAVKGQDKLDALEMREMVVTALSKQRGSVDVRLLPTYPVRSSRGTFDVPNPRQTAALFSAIKQGGGLPAFGSAGVSAIDAGEIPMTVLNGTDTPELAKKQAARLAALGFPPPVGEPAIPTGNGSPHPATVVYHDVGAEQRAKLVAEMYEAEIRPFPEGMSSRTEIVLVLGEDLATGEIVPRDPGQGELSKSKARPSCEVRE